jgi:hypothetical protein
MEWFQRYKEFVRQKIPFWAKKIFVRTRSTRRNVHTIHEEPETSQKRLEILPEPELYEYQPLDPTEEQIRLVKLRRNGEGPVFCDRDTFPLETPLVYCIRLIRLHQSKEGPVRCDISTFALEDAPQYSTLSYTWGAPGLIYYVLVDGEGIQIRENLHQCLQELREEDDGYLWIDQICINQAGVQERNAQVPLMCTIYSQCSSVIVWLNSDSADLSEAARKLGSEWNVDPLFTLFSNDYFRRLWIVQEILLAKTVRI